MLHAAGIIMSRNSRVTRRGTRLAIRALQFAAFAAPFQVVWVAVVARILSTSPCQPWNILEGYWSGDKLEAASTVSIGL